MTYDLSHYVYMPQNGCECNECECVRSLANSYVTWEVG